jgi:hypothetical protein
MRFCSISLGHHDLIALRAKFGSPFRFDSWGEWP